MQAIQCGSIARLSTPLDRREITVPTLTRVAIASTTGLAAQENDPMPICYCLVPDASGTRLLLESDPEGWRLPTVEHDNGWFAHEAVAVARQLGDRLGIRLVALPKSRRQACTVI